MPKISTTSASYPSGAVIAHDGEVLNTPDEGNTAPRIEDESRPGGADNATPIDQANSQDDRVPDWDKQDEAPAKPAKRAPRAQR